MRYSIGLMILALIISGESKAQTPRSAIGDWHKLVSGVAKELTSNEQSDQFLFEYNSRFADVAVGTILRPVRGGRSSSMSVIGRCKFDSDDIDTDSAYTIPASATEGEFSLSARGSTPPSFLVRALGGARAGLSLSRERSLSYAFEDVALKQVSETDLENRLNSSSCKNQFGGQRVVFVVRGSLQMKLGIAQSNKRASEISLGADLVKTDLNDAAKVGFDVGWNSSNEWKIEQKAARPWFRIVTKMVRQPDGTYEIAE